MKNQIDAVSEVLYRFDPADTSANRHNLIDEYNNEASLLVENYNQGLIKDKDDLFECMYDIMKEYFMINIEYNADMINELYEVLGKRGTR